MNEFLNNVYLGKNNLWRYIITVILTFIISNVGAGLIVGVALVLFTVIFHGSLNLQVLMGSISNPLTFLLIVAVGFAISLIFLYIGVKFIHRREFVTIINSRNRIDWFRVLRGSVAWVTIIGVLDIISFVAAPESFRVSFNPSSFGWLLLLALLAFPVQASFEELFFRGYLMQGMWTAIKRPLPLLIVNSLAFSVLHWWNGTNLTMSLSITISTFIIGFVLGLITLADNGVELAMGVHITNNLYVSVIHSSPDSGLGELPSIIVSPSDPYLSPVFLLVAAATLVMILFRGRYDDLKMIFRQKSSNRNHF